MGLFIGLVAACGSGADNSAPAPQTSNAVVKIMPLGDSITDGVGSSHNAGYRLELFRLSVTNNKKLTFVGSHESGPDMVDGKPFPKKQEGHSGWTIDDGGGRSGLYPQIQGWLTATPPHIVTLMIGTNDINGNNNVADAPNRLGKLLDSIFTKDANVLVVLAQIVPTKTDGTNNTIKTYNAAMPNLVSTRVNQGRHIVLVDMYGAFTKDTNYKNTVLGDNLHPNQAGYNLMADVWFKALDPYLH